MTLDMSYESNPYFLLYKFHISHFTEKELEKLKFQSSDDMNDCVKYISAINDKLNQVEMLNQNQHNYTEYEWRKKDFSHYKAFYFQ